MLSFYIRMNNHLIVNPSSTQQELEETKLILGASDKQKEKKSSLKRKKQKLVIYDLENEGGKEASNDMVSFK